MQLGTLLGWFNLDCRIVMLVFLKDSRPLTEIKFPIINKTILILAITIAIIHSFYPLNPLMGVGQE